MTLRQILPRLCRFLRDEDGIVTFQNLFLIMACCAVGATGLDTTYYYEARTHLQVAADVGAHAALFTRYHGRTEAQAKAAAVQVASYGMPSSYGTVLEAGDIVFGTWTAAGSTFTALPAGSTAMPTAVQVTTKRAGDNPVGSLLFRIVGIKQLDVRALATYTSAGDPCSSLQGMFGVGAVSPNSNNTFSAGVCVHSQKATSVQNNPSFASGSHISAPSLSDVTCQNKCAGFDDAKRRADYDLGQFYAPLQGATTGPALLAQVQQVMQLMPSWSWNGVITSINTVSGTSLAAASSLTGRVNYVNCEGDNLTLSGTWRKTVLLLNDCKVKAEEDLILSDTVLYNTNTDSRTSFNFGSGSKAANLVIGDDTDCNGTGAAWILTRGGFDAPAKMTLNNGTIIARGNVKFAAQFGGSDGTAKGLSIISAGAIDTTSNSAFAACPPSAGAPPVLPTFRLAR